jgi:Uma2 family endonuclease
MDTPSIFGRRRLLLRDVDWRSYWYFLHMFKERRGVRLTYDGRRLEIKGVSFKHERYSCLLGGLVLTLTMELHLPLVPGGSTTLYLRRKRRGIDPDNCYWITSASLLLERKKNLDLRIDPLPDLVIEVDIPASALDRMAVFAVLGVPEVWRFDDRVLMIHVLGNGGSYESVPSSRLFPFLTPEDLMRYLEMEWTIDDNAIIREFRTWLRQKAQWK